MCHFLTISIPGEGVPQVPDNFRPNIHFTEQMNRSVTEQAPPDWTSFTVTSEGCSCDFYRSQDFSQENKSKLVRKYQKKGWSDYKIQRVLANEKAAPIRTSGLRNDILDLVTELTHAYGQIRLSLHWYSGDVETENFNLNDAGRVSLENFRSDSSVLSEESTILVTESV